MIYLLILLWGGGGNSPFIAYLKSNPHALALYNIALIEDCHSEKSTKKINLKTFIENNYTTLNYKSIFKLLFYNVSYADYLFSLPMGAGKTYLMAAFIYLDLYFALNEPNNKNFAHNFIILAPSGLKSSILPSLQTITKFDVRWILPEPSASKLKNLVKFEILNQTKTGAKSNQIKNPNVAKIATHQPFDSMMGLILLTNAEKVILDKFDKDTLANDLIQEEKTQWIVANELRETIAKIPNLAIFIDEVHHVVSKKEKDEEVKLRKIVNEWHKNGSINMVAGFSGTPYSNEVQDFIISEDFTIKHKDISNVVYYYPLKNGIGNFLKTPIVKTISSSNRLEIVEESLKDFFLNSKIYANALNAKIAIYCGNIEILEEQIYPKVCEILSEFKLDRECVLKFHKGSNNKNGKFYPEPKDAELEFANLDSEFSKIKVILLVGIGKEGWDCKSLSAVVLSQKKDCPLNMVLQTSCRCLRQVEKGKDEKAVIYLNEENKKLLIQQLEQEQKLILEDFQKPHKKQNVILQRFNRMKQVDLKPISYYQFRIITESFVLEKANIGENLRNIEAKKENLIIKKSEGFSFQGENTTVQQKQSKEIAHFNAWLYEIIKEGFYSLKPQDLKPYESKLKALFNTITIKENESLFFNANFNRKALESSIRKAFYDKRIFKNKKELIPQKAELLIIKNLQSPIEITLEQVKDFIPQEEQVQKIIEEDCGNIGTKLTQEQKQSLIEMLGKDLAREAIRKKENSTPHKDKSYHYLPYRTDSAYERLVFEQILNLDSFEKLNLELYYNGDNTLSEFKIQVLCENTNIGQYTPDFLILQRREKAIYKILIIETKGQTFAANFQEKKVFMDEFVKTNNDKFGYEKFHFLYLQDDVDKDKDLILKINETLQKFFNAPKESEISHTKKQKS